MNYKKITESKKNINFIIIVISALLFIPFLGNVHLFDWDEINFAEAAREMIVTHDYLNVKINYRLFWEKPPLFIWMQVLSMKIFGINEFAARFPNAVAGIITLLTLFNIGAKIKNNKFGIIWVLFYVGSVLPHFYFRSGIIDPWFNLFIFLGIYFIILYFDKTKIIYSALSAFFIGLATLTKGPVALLIFGLTGLIFLFIKKFRVKLRLIDIFIYTFIYILTGGFWFILQIAYGHFDLVKEFIEYQIRLFSTHDAGHRGFWGYHFIVLFFGVFPASVFAIKSLKVKNSTDYKVKDFLLWQIILFWVVLILFSIVKTKIVHYSSLCYFPITFMAANTTFLIFENKSKLSGFQKISILSIAVIYAIVLFALQYAGTHAQSIIESGIIKDKFANANLQANVDWWGLEFLAGIFIVSASAYFMFFASSAKKAIYGITMSGVVFVWLTIMLFVGRIEGYSQRAAINFYISKQNEDCYVENLGFKSYADLFYWQKKPLKNINAYDENWLLTGDIDKNVYFVTKNTKKDNILSKYKDIKVIREKNGFVFLKRLKK